MLGRRPDNLVAGAEDLQPKVFHGMLQLLGGFASRRTTRPAVLIIEPGLQSESLRLIGAVIGQCHPLRAEVFRGQPGARMEKDPAHPHLFENADLPEEFLFFQLSIPGPKRFASKGHPGIFPFLMQR